MPVSRVRWMVAALLWIVTQAQAEVRIPDTGDRARTPAARTGSEPSLAAVERRSDPRSLAVQVAMTPAVYRAPATGLLAGRAASPATAGWIDSVELLPPGGSETQGYGLVMAGMVLIGVVVLRRKLELERNA